MCQLLLVDFAVYDAVGGRLNGVPGIMEGDIITKIEDGKSWGSGDLATGTPFQVPGITCAQFDLWLSEVGRPRLEESEEDRRMLQQHTDSEWYEIQVSPKFAVSTSILTARQLSNLGIGNRAEKEAAVKGMLQKGIVAIANRTVNRTLQKEDEDTRIGEVRTGR